MFEDFKVLNALPSFPLFSSISMQSIMKSVLVPSFGPGGVRALPLGVAAEGSVHY